MNFDSEKKKKAYEKLREVFGFTGIVRHHNDDIIHDVEHLETSTNGIWVSNGSMSSENLDSKEIVQLWQQKIIDNKKHFTYTFLPYDFIIHTPLSILIGVVFLNLGIEQKAPTK